MSQFISEIQVSVNKNEEEQLLQNGFTQNPVNLNLGNCGDEIFLWYKKASYEPVTRIQLSSWQTTNKGLQEAGFTKVDKDLNARSGGPKITLWYKKQYFEWEVPITDLFVSTIEEDAMQLFQFGWERLSCNLNQGNEGNILHLWVKRSEPVFVSEIRADVDFNKATEYFKEGFTRVDADTNRGAEGSKVFLYFKYSRDKEEGLCDLKISTSKQDEILLEHLEYNRVEGNLNNGTEGPEVYLYTKKWELEPSRVKPITLVVRELDMLVLSICGIKLVLNSLNTNNSGVDQFICYG